MRLVAAPHDERAGLNLLCPQEPHDVGDLNRTQFAEQRHPRHHRPGDDEVAAMDLLGERGRDDTHR